MAQTDVLTDTQYTRLVSDIRRIIDEGRTRAARAANQELVRTYWEVGHRIRTEGLTSRGGYGDSILEDLAEELDIDLATLHRCIHFSQIYASVPTKQALTWSHYKVLIPLSDSTKRKFYEKLTQEDGLTAAQLAAVVKGGRFEDFQRDKGKNTRQKKLVRPHEPTYVYKALPERVIDGDTILLRLDLGFTVWKEQRVRLAGIDCPPMDRPKGRTAFEYVRAQMAQVPFVLVKTNKIDIYGRYVGHIFYSFKGDAADKIFRQGRYLNQELVDKGLAKVI